MSTTATMPEFKIERAVRKAVPLLISLSGTSGSGKTFSGLLLAAGIAGPNGRVGMIDTENGRGSLYADDKDIIAAMPGGIYDRMDFYAPFSPERYTTAIEAMEKSGVTVCIIDSTTHEWEGEGGCCDIAENNKLKGMPNWAKAKLAHKKFMAHCLSSPMHIIFCLRAREKVKITADSKVIPIGIQPVAEKSFVFEQLLSLQFDEATHKASPIKVPKMLSLFSEPRLITKADGERIREWNQSGRPIENDELLQKRSASIALGGTKAYLEFFAGLTAKERKMLAASVHASNKGLAEQADAEAAAAESDGQPPPEDVMSEQRRAQADKLAKLPDRADFPDAMEFDIGALIKVDGKIYATNLDRTSWNEYRPAQES